MKSGKRNVIAEFFPFSFSLKEGQSIDQPGAEAREGLDDDRQAESAKIFVKGGTGHVIEQSCDDDKGKGVTKGKAVISPVMLENVFSIFSHTVAIGTIRSPGFTSSRNETAAG